MALGSGTRYRWASLCYVANKMMHKPLSLKLVGIRIDVYQTTTNPDQSADHVHKFSMPCHLLARSELMHSECVSSRPQNNTPSYRVSQ